MYICDELRQKKKLRIELCYNCNLNDEENSIR